MDTKEEHKLIEAIRLSKKYGTQVAVRGLSFRAEKGKVLGFLGPNGAGKSTTMNMLTGYISATEGKVLVNGIDMYEEPEAAKRNIGYLPEIPPVYPDMTVTEYLVFVAELKGVPKKECAAMLEDVMQRTGISDVSGRLIKHLSKGYRQRVGLAGALVGYPEVLILDEPTVGLDPKQIIEIRDLIRSLSQDHTIILSSHILSEISEICDEIMIINKGRLVAVGTPEALMARLKGGKTVIIDIPAGYSREAAETVLNALETGTSEDRPEWKLESEGADGSLTYSVTELPGCDVRKALFFGFANAGIPLYRIEQPDRSLEELFLEMTGEKEERR